MGYTIDEMVGHNVFEFLHPDDMAIGTDLFGSIIQTPGGVAKGETRYRRKDGAFRWVEATGTNLLDDENVRAVVVNYRDITERKQAEERSNRQMINSVHCAKSILPSVPVSIYRPISTSCWNKRCRS